MNDFPTTRGQSDTNARPFTDMTARAIAAHRPRRRSPEDILMAKVRREQARHPIQLEAESDPIERTRGMMRRFGLPEQVPGASHVVFRLGYAANTWGIGGLQ